MSNTNKRYNEEFKKQIVELINSGKNINEVVKEYNIARSTVKMSLLNLKTKIKSLRWKMELHMHTFGSL